MTEHASADRPGWLFRTHHDPSRPAVDTGVAAKRLMISRQAVTDQVRAGRLPGYAIQGPKRARWWVYADALDVLGPAVLPARYDVERERDALRQATVGLREILELRDQIDETSARLDKHLRAAGDARDDLAELNRRLARLTADVVMGAAGPQSPADLPTAYGRGTR